MKPKAGSPAPPLVPPGGRPSYAERLAALEARRRTTDDFLIRKMLHLRDTGSKG
jgi:hypothetical protein